MASSNIKLFDENKGNMLTDTEFNISTQRLNGLQTGVASSQLQNKAMYQASLVAYAIAQIMLQNGLNANDTDAVSAFVANLSNTMLQKVHDVATTEEAQAGVANGKWMSPALVKSAIDALAAKAQNILSDETKASFYGLQSTATPDDAFVEIAKKIGSKVTVYTEKNTTVTATNGSLSITKNSGSKNTIDFLLVAFGNWVFSANVDGNNVTKSVNVSNFNSQTIALVPKFANASWSFISTIAELGVANIAWNIGDTKQFTINGAKYDAQIIGFNHDTKTAGGVAGITLETKTCYGTKGQMNTTATNAGGWRDCAMRNSTLPALFAKMNSDLVAVIKKVNKITSAGSNSATLITTSDTLFLLSEYEYYGTSTYAVSGEGKRYAYYAAGNTAAKSFQGSSPSLHWERSPRKNMSSQFCQVGNNGQADYDGNGANFNMPFSIAFCV